MLISPMTAAELMTGFPKAMEEREIKCGQGQGAGHAYAVQVLVIDDKVFGVRGNGTADTLSISFEVVEGGIGRFFGFVAAAKACLFKFPVSFKYLGFQTVAAYTAVGRGADGVDLSGAYYTVGYEAAAPLLRHADVLFFKAVVVNVREKSATPISNGGLLITPPGYCTGSCPWQV